MTTPDHYTPGSMDIRDHVKTWDGLQDVREVGDRPQYRDPRLPRHFPHALSAEIVRPGGLR